MSFEYDYTREVVDGAYNIDNPKTADGEGLMLHCAKYIETALPGKQFVLRCIGPDVKVVFEEELSAPDQATLATAISDYKALTEAP